MTFVFSSQICQSTLEPRAFWISLMNAGCLVSMVAGSWVDASYLKPQHDHLTWRIEALNSGHGFKIRLKLMKQLRIWCCHYLLPSSLIMLGHQSLFCAATSLLIWNKMFCVRDISNRLIGMEFINMFSMYNYCGFNTQPFCSDVCGDHRRPQTLAEMCKNMAICYGYRSVATRVKYPGFM